MEAVKPLITSGLELAERNPAEFLDSEPWAFIEAIPFLIGHSSKYDRRMVLDCWVKCGSFLFRAMVWLMMSQRT
jgi:hypothetical protein